MQTSRRQRQTLTTEGLIIREFNGVGEADRFITILTKDKGVVRAAVRGARRIKSRSGSATGLLMFSRLRLIVGRDTYVVEDAQPLKTFFGLREDIEKTALAQYFCELAGALCPADEPAPDALQLLLRALQYLEQGARPLPLLKAAVEWRLLCEAGYRPALDGCAVCGQDDCAHFSVLAGQLYCPAHVAADTVPLSAGTLAAMRFVAACPIEKCLQFSLGEPSLQQFAQLAETFLKAQLGRGFKTLEFYHTLG